MSALLIKAMNDRLDRMLFSSMVNAHAISFNEPIPDQFESMMHELKTRNHTVIILPANGGQLRKPNTVLCLDGVHTRLKPYKQMWLTFDQDRTEMGLYVLWDMDPGDPSNHAGHFQKWINTSMRAVPDGHENRSDGRFLETDAFSNIEGLRSFEVESVELMDCCIILKLLARKEHAPILGQQMHIFPRARVVHCTLRFEISNSFHI
jgi:hypothetical protein